MALRSVHTAYGYDQVTYPMSTTGYVAWIIISQSLS
jgi:hypothetical protein